MEIGENLASVIKILGVLIFCCVITIKGFV